MLNGPLHACARTPMPQARPASRHPEAPRATRPRPPADRHRDRLRRLHPRPHPRRLLRRPLVVPRGGIRRGLRPDPRHPAPPLPRRRAAGGGDDVPQPHDRPPRRCPRTDGGAGGGLGPHHRCRRRRAPDAPPHRTPLRLLHGHRRERDVEHGAAGDPRDVVRRAGPGVRARHRVVRLHPPRHRDAPRRPDEPRRLHPVRRRPHLLLPPRHHRPPQPAPHRAVGPVAPGDPPRGLLRPGRAPPLAGRQRRPPPVDDRPAGGRQLHRPARDAPRPPRLGVRRRGGGDAPGRRRAPAAAGVVRGPRDRELLLVAVVGGEVVPALVQKSSSPRRSSRARPPSWPATSRRRAAPGGSTAWRCATWRASRT